MTRRRDGVARSRAAGLYPAFAGLGATGAIVPAALPTLAERVGVPTAAVLPAVPLLFTGLFVGVAVMPILTRRAGAGRIVALGALLQAVSLLGLAVAGTTGLVVSAAAAAGSRPSRRAPTASRPGRPLSGRPPSGRCRRQDG